MNKIPCELIYTGPDGYTTACKGVVTPFRAGNEILYNACSFHINLYKKIEVMLGMGYELETLEELTLEQINKIYKKIPEYYKQGFYNATKRRRV